MQRFATQSKLIPMVVEPKIRGFICTAAHPTGCRAKVKQQIDYCKTHPCKGDAPKNVLVIGASAGYGLASRITCAFSGGAATLGIIFDKPASGKRTASAGWYNTAAFEEFAHAEGLYAKTINGDGFSAAVKQQAIDMIQADLGKIDMVVYSLAAPRRTDEDGVTWTSVLKTTEGDYTNKTIDLKTREVSDITIPQATEEEIAHTVKVMGGEDWMDWMCALSDADVLTEDCITIAYSYIGPELTHPIYLNGSIGQAKRDLYDTSVRISDELGLRGYISVNKALVTQSSSAIPIVPLYISILYKIMKEKGMHEGCIEQMNRLFCEKLPSGETDCQGQFRLDDWEMRSDVQAEVTTAWEALNSNNIESLSDIDGYWQDFYEMFGFNLPGIDYAQDVDIEVKIPSIHE